MLSQRTGAAQSLTTTLKVDFSPFLNEPAIVLAVSGGSDSTALMVLARQAFAANRIVAVTVDHGLRPEAADEARAVGALAKQIGIKHHILKWQGEKPACGIQAAARQARLELLTQSAREIGARVVLTGHTADDQAETVLMRVERGAGIGLAGIAPATLYRGSIWFARPLLQQRREDLRAFLRADDIGWANDSSNNNPAFERVRIRERLAADSAVGFEQALATAERAAVERRRLSVSVAELIDRYARIAEGPAIECDAALLAEPDALHALRLLIATAGDAKLLPDQARTAALMQDLQKGDGGSLANARVNRRSDRITIIRDQRGRSGPLPRFASPFSKLLPSFDLAVAAAIARLLGDKAPPVTPWT